MTFVMPPWRIGPPAAWPPSWRHLDPLRDFTRRGPRTVPLPSPPCRCAVLHPCPAVRDREHVWWVVQLLPGCPEHGVTADPDRWDAMPAAAVHRITLAEASGDLAHLFGSYGKDPQP